MFNNVKIGDKTVPMMSVASTDVYFRSIFHEDPIDIQSGEMDGGKAINLFMRLGFVMAKFAELKDRKAMLALNEDAYLDWLDGFGRTEYIEALPDIQKTYEGQSVTTSDAKKKEEEPTGE